MLSLVRCQRPTCSSSSSLSALMLSGLFVLLLALAAPDAARAAPQPEAVGHPGAIDNLPEDLAEMLRRDPSYVVGILEQLGEYRKPLENTKRGIDFGLGRGYSGNQAAKHMMGLVASQYAGGPGKRKRGQIPATYELPSVYYHN